MSDENGQICISVECTEPAEINDSREELDAGDPDVNTNCAHIESSPNSTEQANPSEKRLDSFDPTVKMDLTSGNSDCGPDILAEGGCQESANNDQGPAQLHSDSNPSCKPNDETTSIPLETDNILENNEEFTSTALNEDDVEPFEEKCIGDGESDACKTSEQIDENECQENEEESFELVDEEPMEELSEVEARASVDEIKESEENKVYSVDDSVVNKDENETPDTENNNASELKENECEGNENINQNENLDTEKEAIKEVQESEQVQDTEEVQNPTEDNTVAESVGTVTSSAQNLSNSKNEKVTAPSETVNDGDEIENTEDAKEEDEIMDVSAENENYIIGENNNLETEGLGNMEEAACVDEAEEVAAEDEAMDESEMVDDAEDWETIDVAEADENVDDMEGKNNTGEIEDAVNKVDEEEENIDETEENVDEIEDTKNINIPDKTLKVNEIEETDKMNEIEEIKNVDEVETGETENVTEETDNVIEMEETENFAETENVTEETDNVIETEETENLDETGNVNEIAPVEGKLENAEMKNLESDKENRDEGILEDIGELEIPAVAEEVENIDETEVIEKIYEIEEIEKVDEIEETEKVDEIEETEKVDENEGTEKVYEIEETEKIYEIEETEKVDEIEETENVDEIEEIKEVSETAETEKVDDLPENENIEKTSEIETNETKNIENTADDDNIKLIEEHENPEKLEQVSETGHPKVEATCMKESQDVSDVGEIKDLEENLCAAKLEEETNLKMCEGTENVEDIGKDEMSEVGGCPVVQDEVTGNVVDKKDSTSTKNSVVVAEKNPGNDAVTERLEGISIPLGDTFNEPTDKEHNKETGANSTDDKEKAKANDGVEVHDFRQPEVLQKHKLNTFEGACESQKDVHVTNENPELSINQNPKEESLPCENDKEEDMQVDEEVPIESTPPVEESIILEESIQQDDSMAVDDTASQPVGLVDYPSDSEEIPEKEPSRSEEKTEAQTLVHAPCFEEDAQSSWSIDAAKNSPVKMKDVTMVADEDSRSVDTAKNNSMKMKDVTSVADEDSRASSFSQKSATKRPHSDEEAIIPAFSAEQLFEYRWPSDGGDFYLIQEHVSEYLGVKSFKRKYPDLSRRFVEVGEKRFLKDKNVVSETLCDLGLTAIRSDDVLELMSKDYPDKYQDYIRVLQEREKQKINIKHKEYTTASIDKAKMNDFVMKAIKATAEFNMHLNQERREERRTSFDMQTYTIHIPANKIRKLSKEDTKVGTYPVALLPGQFQDYYRPYSSKELKYFPLNSVLYGPLKELPSVYAQPGSDGSQSDSDDSCASEGSSCSSSPGTQDSGDSSSGSESAPTHKMEVSSEAHIPTLKIKDKLHAACKVCHGTNERNKDGFPEELIHCAECGSSGHPSCLDVTSEMVDVIRTYAWQCMDCKTCMLCMDPYDEDKMMFCDKCDRGYHTFCVGLKNLPNGRWICQSCGQCSSCGARAPGPEGSKAQWQQDCSKSSAEKKPHLLCLACAKPNKH